MDASDPARQPSHEEVTFADVYPHPLVRALVFAACSGVVCALVLWNLPIPGIQARVRAEATPLMDFANLDQDWSLFAPDASGTSIFIHIEVIPTDGSVRRLDFPEGGAWFGNFRGARWSSYEEELYDDPVLQESAFQWAYDRHPDAERIELIVLESGVSTGTHGPFEHVYERAVLASWNP